jgi:hypothetical protein
MDMLPILNRDNYYHVGSSGNMDRKISFMLYFPMLQAVFIIKAYSEYCSYRATGIGIVDRGEGKESEFKVVVVSEFIA